MTSLTPLIKYSFESWTLGSTTIVNEGYSGSANNGVLTNIAIVISSDYAVGSKSLLVGNRGSTSAYSYLSITGPVSLTNDFTICFWNKCPAGFVGNSTIFKFANSSGYVITLNVKQGNNYLSFSCIDQTNMQFFDYTTTSSISSNTWHHYAFVCSYTDTNCYVYVDGSLMFTSTGYSYNVTDNTSNWIGSPNTPSVYLFDDFRVYTSALQLSDITSLYNLYSNPGVFIPALHYSFDQWTTGTTIVQNEGTLGSAFDATLSHINIIFPPSPTGYNHLSLSAAS